MDERPRKWNEITHLLQAPIALMLAAYAIETLLKMVIVGAHCDKHGIDTESRRAKDFLPTNHDLVALVKQANLRVNGEDRRLLADLARYSLWAGRYPIPLRSDGYTGPALFEAVEPAPATVARHHPTWPKLKRYTQSSSRWRFARHLKIEVSFSSRGRKCRGNHIESARDAASTCTQWMSSSRRLAAISASVRSESGFQARPEPARRPGGFSAFKLEPFLEPWARKYLEPLGMIREKLK